MKYIRPKSVPELQEFIKTGESALYTSARTSTVIPFDKEEALKSLLKAGEKSLVELTQLNKKMQLEGENLRLTGPVSWEEGGAWLRAKGRDLKAYPTETSAVILAGIATSCTGERSFGFGPFRDHIIECSFLNYKGELIKLHREESIEKFFSSQNLKAYQQRWQQYSDFKNAPFPRFDKAIDLMVGTEGQLGVVVEALIETTDFVPLSYLLIPVKPWAEDYSEHLKLLESVQSMRGSILSCELLDRNSHNVVKDFDNISKDHDIIALEFRSDDLEKIYTEVIAQKGFQEDKIYQMEEAPYNLWRKSIPRLVNERNSRKGVIKKGTDTQVMTDQMKDLFELYKKATKLGVDYNLFGHFGDRHLHFNFLPLPEQVVMVESFLEDFYKEVKNIKASPFAEHGVGLIKQPFMQTFYNDIIFQVFKDLKQAFDPRLQFFPSGFLSMEEHR